MDVVVVELIVVQRKAIYWRKSRQLHMKTWAALS